MKKRLRTVFCMIFSLWLMSLQTSAMIVEPVMPYWETVNKVDCSITFVGTTGTVVGTVIGKTGTTKIEGTLKLYEDGEEIEEWPISTTTSRVSILDSFTGESGSTYTLELDVDVTCNGTVETIQTDDSHECP